MAKQKISFTLDGIKYTDIDANQWSGSQSDKYYVSVAGTAKMVRQYIKHKYPNIPASNYYWVQSQSYSGGDSIRVYFNNAPESFINTFGKEIKFKFQEGSFDGMNDLYTSTKETETAKEGIKVDYGTKYLFVNNQKPYDSDAPEVDWSNVLSEAKPKNESAPKSGGLPKPSFSRGEVIMDCSGWEITKKTLPDGRVVYNCAIKKDTPKNKADWDVIRGEIYTETGFKWGRFGAFEKWGSIASEAYVISLLCKILGKYYIQTENQPKQETKEEPKEEPKEDRGWMVGDIFYPVGEISSKYYIKSITSDGDVGVASIKNPDSETIFGTIEDVNKQFNKGLWVIYGRYDYPETKSVKSKEDIEKAIKGLQYLADKGNEKAIKAIKGLKILLNK